MTLISLLAQRALLEPRVLQVRLVRLALRGLLALRVRLALQDRKD